MNLDCDDVIAAPASAAGAAARAIIRISGAGSPQAALAVFTPEFQERWLKGRRPERFPGRVRWKSSYTESEVTLPAAGYRWSTSRSFTGQPLVELHLPGSPPVVAETLAALYRSGVRPARPGEFTLRAFLAGRIDLVQAEAVLGVIDAADPQELNVALQQLAGGISSRLAVLRGTLLTLLADLEAGLDFVEEDIEFVSREEVLNRAGESERELRTFLADAVSRWTENERFQVVLAGLPNAGKSALFNALAGAEKALVSSQAGTTRDWLSAETAVGRIPIELIDTAGWEIATDDLESAMQRLRAERIERADLVLWCSATGLSAADRQLDEDRFAGLRSVRHDRVLHITTKADLQSDPEQDGGGLRVSSMSGTGLEELRQRLARHFEADHAGDRQMLGSTAARSRESLAAAVDALQRLQTAGSLGFGDEVLAAELRAALDGLAAILGDVYTDDVLDVIFSRFCIGK